MAFFSRQFSSLLRSTKGSALIFVALGAVTLITAVGAAVDMARLQTLQSRISHALDAAGLAAGATSSDVPATFPSNCPVDPNATAQQKKLAWVQCQAYRYFAANIPADYLASNILQPIQINVAQGGQTADCPTNGTICLSVTAAEKTTFMHAVGVAQMNVSATSVITLAQNSGLEVVLALDNTGSMNAILPSDPQGKTKLAALKTSVASLLNILYGGTNASNDVVYGPDGSTPILWVGLVPYSDMVNVGKRGTGTTATDYTAQTYAAYSQSALLSSYINGSIPTGWTGCVDARTVSVANAISYTSATTTSVTTNTIPTKSVLTSSPLVYKTSPSSFNFTVAKNLNLPVGSPIIAAATGGSMEGTVTAYNAATGALTIGTKYSVNSGTYSLWTLTSGVQIGAGDKIFTVPAGLNFVAGQTAIAMPDQSGYTYGNYEYMAGTVKSYDSVNGTLVITVPNNAITTTPTSPAPPVLGAYKGSDSYYYWTIEAGPTSNFYNNDSCASQYGTANCSLASNNLSYDISLDTTPTFTPLVDYNPITKTPLYDSPMTGLFAIASTPWSANGDRTKNYYIPPIDQSCPQPVLPMASSQTTVLNAVNSMTGQGNTMINMGLAWGWRMMNSGGPWQATVTKGGAWAGSGLSGVTTAYNTLVNNNSLKEQKVLILMTDGANTDPGVNCSNVNPICANGYTNMGGYCCTNPQMSSGGSTTCGCQYNCVKTCTPTCSVPLQDGVCPAGESGTSCNTACQTGNYCTDGTTCVGDVSQCPASAKALKQCGYGGVEYCPDYQANDTASNVVAGYDTSNWTCQAYESNWPNAYMDLTTSNPNYGGGHKGCPWNKGDYGCGSLDSYNASNGAENPETGDFNRGGAGATGLNGFSYMETYITTTDPDLTLGNNPGAAQGTAPALDNATRNICDAIKAQGIVVYTIGFGSADGVQSVDSNCNSTACPTYANGPLLQYCASPGKYYFANSSTALQGVFQTIGNSLNHLRISQ